MSEAPELRVQRGSGTTLLDFAVYLCWRARISMGGRIEREDGFYLWATFRSKVFRFVDDVQFRMDLSNQVIHVRSAARLGYTDFGMNRKRVEAL